MPDQPPAFDEQPFSNLQIIFLHWLLLKLGRKMTMNVGEIEPITSIYAGIRLAYNT